MLRSVCISCFRCYLYYFITFCGALASPKCTLRVNIQCIYCAFTPTHYTFTLAGEESQRRRADEGLPPVLPTGWKDMSEK